MKVALGLAWWKVIAEDTNTWFFLFIFYLSAVKLQSPRLFLRHASTIISTPSSQTNWESREEQEGEAIAHFLPLKFFAKICRFRHATSFAV